jgi:hypothetical protein
LLTPLESFGPSKKKGGNEGKILGLSNAKKAKTLKKARPAIPWPIVKY